VRPVRTESDTFADFAMPLFICGALFLFSTVADVGRVGNREAENIR
jgi:hypothetical protein